MTSADEVKTCPYCAEEIKTAAIRCRHCSADLRAGMPASGPGLSKDDFRKVVRVVALAVVVIWGVFMVAGVLRGMDEAENDGRDFGECVRGGAPAESC